MADGVRVRRSYRSFLERAPWDDDEAMARLQDELLRRLVCRAAVAVPAVQARLRQAGVAAADIRGVADLAALAPVDKQDLLVAGRSALIDPDVRGAPGMTSGTSGQPLPLWFDRLWWARSQTARAFLYRRLGVGRGTVVEFLEHVPHGRGPGRRHAGFLGFDRRVVPFTLPVGEQADLVERLAPRALYGNRSALLLVAEELQRRGRRLEGARLAVSTGEVLAPADRQRIADGLGAPVHDLYGQSELSIVCWEDVPEGGYRVLAPRVVVEVLHDGRPVGSGEVGEIVLTGLDNPAMPLVRYATGDLAELAAGSGPSGHPGLRLQRVLGREIDVLRTTAGQPVHPGPAMYGHPWHDPEVLALVRRHQVEQVSLDLVQVRLVADQPVPVALQEAIRRHLRDLLGPLQVEVVVVDELPLGANGKYKQVISRV